MNIGKPLAPGIVIPADQPIQIPQDVPAPAEPVTVPTEAPKEPVPA